MTKPKRSRYSPEEIEQIAELLRNTLPEWHHDPDYTLTARKILLALDRP